MIHQQADNLNEQRAAFDNVITQTVYVNQYTNVPHVQSRWDTTPFRRPPAAATLYPTRPHFEEQDVRQTDFTAVQVASRAMANNYWAQWRKESDERLKNTGWTPSYDHARQNEARAQENQRWQAHRERFFSAA